MGRCGGSGIVEDNKALECVIEAGMVDGDELTFPGEANVEDPEEAAGDLSFRCGPSQVVLAWMRAVGHPAPQAVFALSYTETTTPCALQAPYR